MQTECTFEPGLPNGNLQIRKRKKGPDVWQFRYIDNNGKRTPVLIGPVEKYPNKADAERAVEHLRMQVNAQNPQQRFHSFTVGALIHRFMKEYAPKHCRLNTRRDYGYSFETHVRPIWGTVFVQNVKTMAVQDWLDSYPYSRQVKAHIRRYMHVLFNQAVRWELLDRNPITLVKQSGKRLKTPRALTPEEFKAFLARISHQFSRIGFEGAESLDSDRVLKAFVEKPPVDEPA